MALIIAGHFLLLGGLTNAPAGWPRYVAYLMGSGPRIGVDVFLMLGVWFMVDTAFSARRIMKLYLQVFLYSVTLTGGMLLIGEPVATVDVIRGFLPFWGRPLWFASAYIVLLFWAPFLKRVFMLPRRAQALLLVTIFLFASVVCTMPDPQLSYVCDLYWFACIYLFIGFVKHETDWVRRVRPSLCIAGGLVLYAALATLRWWGETTTFGGGRAVGALAMLWLNDFKTVPNLLASFLIFIGFAGLDLGSRKWINRIAQNTFGVYIIHCVPAFWPFLFLRVCHADVWIYSPWIVPMAFGMVVGVFAGGSLIDEVRRRFLAPWYEQIGVVSRICDKIDGIYQTCGMKT